MFGYLKPNRPYLYLKDETLYNALYCGLCKSIGETCGQVARFSLTYDITFLSAIMHNLLGIDISINKERCIAHQIKSRPISKPDDISRRLADVNVILAYYKLQDDVYDDNSGRLKKSIIGVGYNKAFRRSLDVNSVVEEGYNALRKLENEKCESVDIVSDCFAMMLQNISRILLKDKTTEYTDTLFYSIGKWVYLVDALDDYDKDIKKGSYNVLYNCYKSANYEELIKAFGNEIKFIFNGIYMLIADSIKNITFYYNTDLVMNIMQRGIPETTERILNKGQKNVK